MTFRYLLFYYPKLRSRTTLPLSKLIPWKSLLTKFLSRYLSPFVAERPPKRYVYQKKLTTRRMRYSRALKRYRSVQKDRPSNANKPQNRLRPRGPIFVVPSVFLPSLVAILLRWLFRKHAIFLKHQVLFLNLFCSPLSYPLLFPFVLS